MSADLISLVQRLGRPRVLVIGDLMLDRYVWGDAERISQEAPVILLRADRREERLGGASSVATMLQAAASPRNCNWQTVRLQVQTPAKKQPARRANSTCRLRPSSI